MSLFVPGGWGGGASKLTTTHIRSHDTPATRHAGQTIKLLREVSAEISLTFGIAGVVLVAGLILVLIVKEMHLGLTDEADSSDSNESGPDRATHRKLDGSRYVLYKLCVVT